MEVSPEAWAEMNPDDMEKRGIVQGDEVRIFSNDEESLTLRVKRSYRVATGTVLVPHHFSASKINRFTRWDRLAVTVNLVKA